MLTTHVGSLVRPPELVELLRRREHGEPVDETEHEQVLRRAVSDIVAEQVRIGIDVVSDGEFGKSDSWSRYVRQRLGGCETRATSAQVQARSNVPVGTDKQLFPEFYAEYEQTQGFVAAEGEWVCTGPVHYTGQREVGRDIDNLVAAMKAAGAADGFLPVVAPASAIPRVRDEHYGNEADLLFAVADALNEEYRAIVDAGLMVQIDDAHFPIMYDVLGPDRWQQYREWAELRTQALVRALDGIPAHRARYHVCWGSWNAPHVGDVPLRDIVDLILRVPVGAYSLEQANPRHEHEWRVWEQVALPEGRSLIPGVISHATNVVEHPELVAERLVRLAHLVGPDRVQGGTDCGFAQGPLVRRVHPSIQHAKLKSLVEGAQLATHRLG